MRKISREELKDLEDSWGEPLTLWEPDYLNEVIIGVTSDQKVVYSYNALVDLFMKHEDISENEAIDHIDVNLINVYIGEKTPIIMDTEFYDYVETKSV